MKLHISFFQFWLILYVKSLVSTDEMIHQLADQIQRHKLCPC